MDEQRSDDYILLHRYTKWTLTKRMEKKLDSIYKRMLRDVLNKSWRQHSTKQQLYSYLPPITKNIQVKRTGHVGHCWRSGDELISNVLLWTPSYGRAKFGRLARTHISQLWADTGCSQKDPSGTMDYSDGWPGRVREIRAGSATWWWMLFYEGGFGTNELSTHVSGYANEQRKWNGII